MKFFIAFSSLFIICASVVLADPIKDNAIPTKLTATATAAATTTTTTSTTARALSECLEADSISCLQFTIYRKAKSIFENPQIQIINGISLVANNESWRHGKAIKENALAVETAPSVEARTVEMGNYFMNAIRDFFTERTLNVNFANVGRSVARAIPDDIKSDLRELVTESRAKKKKIIKKLLPILLGVGAKVAVLSVGALIGLLFLAKKALIISVLAFFMALVAGAGSGFGKFGSSDGFLGGLGGLFGGKNAGGASAGWSAGGSGGWASNLNSGWDSHGAYSSPVGQSLAYSGYKNRR